jgi:hypothetical protein
LVVPLVGESMVFTTPLFSANDSAGASVATLRALVLPTGAPTGDRGPTSAVMAVLPCRATR